MKEIGCGPGINTAPPTARCAYHYSAKGGGRDQVIPGKMAALYDPPFTDVAPTGPDDLVRR